MVQEGFKWISILEQYTAILLKEGSNVLVSGMENLNINLAILHVSFYFRMVVLKTGRKIEVVLLMCYIVSTRPHSFFSQRVVRH